MSDSCDSQDEDRLPSFYDNPVKLKEKLKFKFGKLISRSGIDVDQYIESSDIQKGYDKRRWIKATFDGETKRFAEPPGEIDKLIQLFIKKFGVLRSIRNMLQKDKEAA